MNKNNIYIPSLKLALPRLLVYAASIIALLLSVLITAVFLFLEDFCGFEYFSLVSPFTTLFALIFWLIVLIVPTIKRVIDLLTIYYVNENGDIIKYSMIVNNVESFGRLLEGAFIGLRLGRVVGSAAQGFVAIHNLFKIILGIRLNTNRKFVLASIENENIYKVKKVYGNSSGFKFDKLHKNINEEAGSASLSIKPRLFRYTFIIAVIIIAINIAFTTIAAGNNTSIKNTYNHAQQSVEEKLAYFGYRNKSDKLIKFERNIYDIDSIVILDYDYTGELKRSDSTEVDVYWDFSEDPDNILCEIETILDILEIKFDEETYIDAIDAMQAQESGFTEKSGGYRIYLTKSSGKINLKIHN